MAAAPGTVEVQPPSHSRRGGKTIHPVLLGYPPLAPAEAKRSEKWFPCLIPTFAAANVVVFVITMYVNNCPKNSISCVAGFLGRFSFQPFKENPLLGPSSLALEKMGALDVAKVVDNHEGWRLITCMWLHGGVLHLLANMLSLVLIGIRLEQEFGFLRVGLFYLFSGFGGSLLSALFLRSNISVGASGALFGLLGGILSELIANWTIYANKVAALLTLVVIIAINLAVGLLPHVDNFAHIGGFMSGFLLGFVFLIRPHFGWVNQRRSLAGYSSISGRTSKFKPYQLVLCLLSLILLVVWFSVGLVSLLRGVDLNDRCSWCHYMSCIPTSRWSCNTQPLSCQAVQAGSQYTLTCSNGRNKTYALHNPTASQVQGLCVQVCR